MTKREYIEQATLAFFANPSPQYGLGTITDTADQIYGEEKEETHIRYNERGEEVARIMHISEKQEKIAKDVSKKLADALAKQCRITELWANLFYNYKTLEHPASYELGNLHLTKEDAENEEYERTDGYRVGVAHITWENKLK